MKQTRILNNLNKLHDINVLNIVSNYIFLERLKKTKIYVEYYIENNCKVLPNYPKFSLEYSEGNKEEINEFIKSVEKILKDEYGKNTDMLDDMLDEIEYLINEHDYNGIIDNVGFYLRNYNYVFTLDIENKILNLIKKLKYPNTLLEYKNANQFASKCF